LIRVYWFAGGLNAIQVLTTGGREMTLVLSRSGIWNRAVERTLNYKLFYSKLVRNCMRHSDATLCHCFLPTNDKQWLPPYTCSWTVTYSCSSSVTGGV